jgi:AraC-like DNA-binding protein
VHCHRDFELNFVENAAGAQRIVGDNVETIGAYDLVLIGGENLEHAWKQGECHSSDIREITIQFSADLFSDGLLTKNQFSSIKEMLHRAEHGLSFPLPTIIKVYSTLNTVAAEKESFVQFINFLYLLYQLSLCPDARILAGDTSAQQDRRQEEDRILAVRQYIEEHFTENPTLAELADLVCMTPSAFSRFFKLKTGNSLSNYIIDVKLAYAVRLLVDSSLTISEICYECGFNNQSNFNRIFKSKKGQTPRDFRASFKKNKTIV